VAELLLSFDRALPLLQPCLIAVAIGCWGIGLVRMLINWRARPPRVNATDPVLLGALAIFASIIAFEVALTSVYGYEARTEIAAFCAGGVESLTVDGKPFAPTEDLVSLLIAPRHPWGHHSHPAKTLRVRLTTANGTLDLALRRDSGDQHEYWLFYPRYSVTWRGEIGHVFTDRLDGF
jgi:hypothetical protein